MEVFPNKYVDFFAEDAFEQRRQFITGFYRDGVSRIKERETYLSMEELDTFCGICHNEDTCAMCGLCRRVGFPQCLKQALCQAIASACSLV